MGKKKKSKNSKKKRKPKCRNLDVLFMILHCKGGTIKSDKFKRLKNKELKEMEEQDGDKE